MISFDAAHHAVHYPPDRRFRVWIKPSFIVVFPFFSIIRGCISITVVPLIGTDPTLAHCER